MDQQRSIMDATEGYDSFTSSATVRMLTNAEKGTLHLNGREMPINIFKRSDCNEAPMEPRWCPDGAAIHKILKVYVDFL